MANTVFGPFVAINVVNGTTPANATWANNAQLQASDAWHGFNPDLIGAGFVYSGIVCTKDGTNANQLDIASGRAYVVFTDGTVGLIVVAADNTHTTSVINTTYFLDLNPDGTWSWATTHSGVANHLTICSATTDASGNILVVTDARVVVANLLGGMAGNLGIPMGLLFGAGISGSKSLIVWDSANHQNVYWTPQSGASAQGHLFVTWNGSAQVDAFSIGGQFGGAPAWVDNAGSMFFGGNGANNPHLQWFSGTQATQIWTPQAGAAQWHEFVAWNGSAAVVPLGVGSQATAQGVAGSTIGDTGRVEKLAGQATAGSFGVPVIVAQALDVHVTATTQQQPLTFTPTATGLYRVSIHISMGNTTAEKLTVAVNYTDPHLGTPASFFSESSTAGGVLTALNGANLVGPSASLACAPTVLYAGTGGPITLEYTDPGATPNDFVSAIIERLA